MKNHKSVDNTNFKKVVERLRELGKVPLDRDLADAIGRDKSVVSNILNDITTPSKSVLDRMRAVFGVNINYLKRGAEPMFIDDVPAEVVRSDKADDLDPMREFLVILKERNQLKEEARRKKVVQTPNEITERWMAWATDKMLRNEAYLRVLLIRLSQIDAGLNNQATDDVVESAEADVEIILQELHNKHRQGLA